ncbi:MAG: hypothetical protein H6559_12185 [Lewinellaceae bacterium]|nr:hypothetical protein [Lewinellaceae bacterium]
MLKFSGGQPCGKCNFGYIEREEMNGHPDYLRGAIKPFQSNPETTRIIQRYLSKQNGVKVVPVTG